tara:strand:+ start:265 stop:633 length:369 start_codon:yes stop_codon:yes gene_type:complete
LFQLLLVASGGAAGAVLRFTFNYFIKLYLYNSFYATLCINILGSFFIGYLISLGLIRNISENFIKYFLIIGFLGSFTTFSSFSYEVVELILSKKFFLGILYVISSIFLCIIAAYAGMYINKV